MRIKILFGKILYEIIGKHLPRSFSPIKIGQKQFRAFCGQLILAECGENVNIERGAVFSTKVKLGDNSGIGINCSVGGTVIIGNNVMMGPRCTIYTKNHEFSDVSIPMTEQGMALEEPVVMGDDIWIGGNVTILPGVHIGSHSIIGACAVVTKDVPEYAIVAGNPAVIKKYRK